MNLKYKLYDIYRNYRKKWVLQLKGEIKVLKLKG